jgi:hypothetical protein
MGILAMTLAFAFILTGCPTDSGGGDSGGGGQVQVTFTLDNKTYTVGVDEGAVIDDAFIAAHRDELGGSSKFAVSGLTLNLAKEGAVPVTGNITIPLVWKFKGKPVTTWRTVTFTVNATPYTVSVPDGASLTAAERAALEDFLGVPGGSLAEVDWSQLSNITGNMPPEEKAPGPGASAADPVTRKETIDLSNPVDWENLLISIGREGKYVALDLSGCTMAGGTEFDPGTANTGESKIVSLILPDTAAGIKAGSIDNEAFRYFTALTSVSGSGITTVGNFTFSGCTALTTVSLPVAETIGFRAFSGCSALTTINLPAATRIEPSAFSDCTALTAVSLPAATSIGNYAFSGCSALTTVSLPVVETIGDTTGAFSGCTALTTVSLPASLTSIAGNPFTGCVNLTTIEVDAANAAYQGRGGMLLNKAGTTLDAYPSARGAVTLDAAITRIGGGAFFGCTSLTTVNAPAATSIGDVAFSRCFALATVDLPAATSIGAEAFGYCKALTTVSLPAATSIGNEAFSYCEALTTVSLPAATSIGGHAFGNTGSKRALTVTLGSAVPMLGTSLFFGVSTTKSVTVRVPSGADAWKGKTGTFSGANTTVNWGNGFRGGGWQTVYESFWSNGSAFVNQYISLRIETY